MRITDESPGDFEDESVGYLDWKDPPDEVLENVDCLLRAFGLQIVKFNTRADDILFKIERRDKPCPEN